MSLEQLEELLGQGILLGKATSDSGVCSCDPDNADGCCGDPDSCGERPCPLG